MGNGICDIIRNNMNLTCSVFLAAVSSVTNASPVATNAVQAVSTEAKITSKSVYYDRKEGFAYFNGDVFVDDSNYQLHAARAYVFMSGTNDVRRIVAIGNVAMTNGTKRAYGEKATYYRDPGKVVLSAAPNGVAEVRDEVDGQSRVIRGRKILFWTNSRQVEVLEAEIGVPLKGIPGNPFKGMGK